MTTNGEIALANNIKRIGHLDLEGGGQVVVQGDYAYVGHMKPPHGTSIIDISDPGNPRIVTRLNTPDEFSHTHKVRVVGDLMYTNVEQDQRHFLRKGHALPEVRAKLAGDLGREANPAEVAAAAGVSEADIPALDTARERGYDSGGFCIYDIADKANPKLLVHQKTFGFGVHRFDVDENYAYMSTDMEGYNGNILVIYDVANPAKPVEVSRWSMPGQHVAGGETPIGRGYENRLHHAMRAGNELWAACWQAGLRIIDVSDIRNPKTIGEYNYHPPIPEPSHTFLPLEQEIDGRRIAIVIDEEHKHQKGRLHGFMWVFDITDPGNMQPLSIFDVSELDSPWGRGAGRFGAHQFREKMDGTLVYLTWFAGGLRVVDVADPHLPKEVAHFIPEPVNGAASPQSNDVDVDGNGLIYLLDRDWGLDILEMTLP